MMGDVPAILSPSRLSQIAKAIVMSDAVYMINLKDRHSSIRHPPNRPMGSKVMTENPQLDIAVTSQRPGPLTDFGVSAKPTDNLFPIDDSYLWIVQKRSSQEANEIIAHAAPVGKKARQSAYEASPRQSWEVLSRASGRTAHRFETWAKPLSAGRNPHRAQQAGRR